MVSCVFVIERINYGEWSCEKLRGTVLDDGNRIFEREADCSDGRSHSKGMSCAVIVISKDLLHGKIARYLFFFLFSPRLHARIYHKTMIARHG